MYIIYDAIALVSLVPAWHYTQLLPHRGLYSLCCTSTPMMASCKLNPALPLRPAWSWLNYHPFLVSVSSTVEQAVSLSLHKAMWVSACSRRKTGTPPAASTPWHVFPSAPLVSGRRKRSRTAGPRPRAGVQEADGGALR